MRLHREDADPHPQSNRECRYPTDPDGVSGRNGELRQSKGGSRGMKIARRRLLFGHQNNVPGISKRNLASRCAWWSNDNGRYFGVAFVIVSAWPASNAIRPRPDSGKRSVYKADSRVWVQESLHRPSTVGNVGFSGKLGTAELG